MSNIVVLYILLLMATLFSYSFLSRRKATREIQASMALGYRSSATIRKNNITPVFVFVATFSIYSTVGIFDRIGTDNAELLIFLICCICGLVSFLLGYGLDNARLTVAKKRKTIGLSNKKITSLEIMLVLLFVVCCFLFRDRIIEMILNFGSGKSYNDYSIRADRTATTGLERAFSNYFTLSFLSLPYYRVYKNRKFHFLDIFIILIVSSYALFSGDRTNLILVCLLLAVLFNERFFRLSLPFILISVLTGTLAFVLIGHLRSNNSFESMWNMLMRGDIFELLSLKSSGEFFNTTGTTFSYISTRLNSQYSFDFGYTYFLDLLMYIPTFIFPSRPLPPQEQYMLDFFPNAPSGTGHAWFILTDGYRAFGVFGIIVEMFLFGRFLRFVYRKFFESSSNPLVSYLYVYLLLYVFYSVRSSFLLSIKNYVIAIAPILLIIFLNGLVSEEGIVKNGKRRRSVNYL